MDRKELHDQIVEKFGTLSRFARLSKLDRYMMQKFFARSFTDPVQFRAITRAFKGTGVKSDPASISPAQIKMLQKALKQAGGVNAFCGENPAFSSRSVYQVLSGHRKRMTPMVRRLFEQLDLETV